METTINLEKNNAFQQIYDELKFSLSSLRNSELNSILIGLLKESAVDTYENKKTIVNKIYKKTSEKINKYKEATFKVAFKEDLLKLKTFLKNAPENISKIINSIKKMSKEEKIDLIISYLFALTIFLVAAGGTDIEGGIPDLDITIGGIGMHRSLFFHSILVGITFEFTMRFCYKIVQLVIENLPEDHHKIWDKIKLFIDKNKNLSIAALWLGISVHLIKDTGIVTGNFKPYADLPISLKTMHHKIILTANGVGSSIIGIENLHK
ncbi:hypothetical protein [Melioribacter sp. OK-6-Me]|uniref:hypothetical protein n=1 Tax=unclassified Melioribacter TaxID=2627329 RepID=UPI003EDB359A